MTPQHTDSTDRIITRCSCGHTITALEALQRRKVASQTTNGMTQIGYDCPECKSGHVGLIDGDGHLLADSELGAQLVTAICTAARATLGKAVR